MGKIDYAIGDRLLAEQVNDIGEELNDIQNNIGVIENQVGHWQYIGNGTLSTSGSGSSITGYIYSVPSNASFIVIQFSVTKNSWTEQQQIILDTTNITSSTFQHTSVYTGSYYVTLSVSLSGGTLTFTASSETSTSYAISATAYYYT